MDDKDDKKTVVVEVTDDSSVSSDTGEVSDAPQTAAPDQDTHIDATQPGLEADPLAEELAAVEAESTPEASETVAEPMGEAGVTVAAAESQPTLQVVAAQPPRPTTGRKWATIALIVAVLAGGVTAAVLLTQDKAQVATTKSTTNAPATAPPEAKLGVAVTLVDGTATFVSGDSTASQPLATSSQLAEGDSVATEADSRVVLTFDDGSAVRLDERTKVTLVSLRAKDIRVSQDAGTVYSRLVKSDRQYAVTASGTTYTAQGTAFTTAVGDAQGVQVYESAVKVSGLTDTVTEGKQYYKTHRDSKYANKVTSIDVASLDSDGFAKWNLAEDEKNALFKDKLGIFKQLRAHQAAQKQKAKQTPKPTERPKSTAGLSLSAKAVTGGAELSWTVSGVTAPNGFKLVRSSSSAAPTFGKDDAYYVEDASARKAVWKSDKDGAYWYRVCIYQKEAGCSNYSNAVQVKMTGTQPKHDTPKPTAKVQRGTLTLRSVNTSGKATWSFTGQAPYGYKLLVSSKQQPTFISEQPVRIYR